jgi:hypothetical protein
MERPMQYNDVDKAGHGERGALIAAAISGTLYALGALTPQVDGPPVETATAAQIRTFLTEHDTGLRVLGAGAALAIPLVLVFTVSLARLIRSRLPGSPLADLVIGGGVLVAVWHWLVVAGTATTLVQSLDGTDLATVDDATLRGWYGLSNFTHLFGDLGMPAMATVMAATSIAVLRTGLFARWFGWLGLVLAAGGALGTIGVVVAWPPLSIAWFVGIFGWWPWSLTIAVTCGLRLRRRRRRAVAEPAPALHA